MAEQFDRIEGAGSPTDNPVEGASSKDAPEGSGASNHDGHQERLREK
jgi:hypothetical protein